MKVVEILFDKEKRAPIFILEDGSKWIPDYQPTGSCWLLNWNEDKEEVEDSI